jgi:hypothetical protein
MKKKLMSQGFTSLEILSNSEKKSVKGGFWWYANPCNVGGNRGPVRCTKPNNPGDTYYYCDMASCQATCGINAGYNPASVCV